MKTTQVVSTKIDKDADVTHSTNLTIDWEGASEEQIRALASKQIVVLVQAKFRRDATAKENPKAVPGTFTIAVKDISTKGVIEPVNVETTLARASALSDEDKAKLIAQLTASMPKGGRK